MSKQALHNIMRICGIIAFIILWGLDSLSFTVFAESAEPSLVQTSYISDNQNASDIDNSSNNDLGYSDRVNFDLASLLSLLGVGLLKFIDDKFKIKYKNNFPRYKNILIIATIIFSILEILLLFTFIFCVGSTALGNLKNVILGAIPVVFCILTWLTLGDDLKHFLPKATMIFPRFYPKKY